MAYSYVETTLLSPTTTIAVPFGYLSTSDVQVSVNGVVSWGNSLSWASAGMISWGSTLPAGTKIRVQRFTSLTPPIANFTPSNITHSELNLAFLHALYLLQEAIDASTDPTAETNALLTTLKNAAEVAATAAASSASSASASDSHASSVLTIIQAFSNSLYLGAKPYDPGIDNSGGPLQQGALYYNTTTNYLMYWTGSAWAVSTTPIGGYTKPEVDSLFSGRKLVGLATTVASMLITADVTEIQTVGYSLLGRGFATYVYDASIDAAFAAAHPRWTLYSSNGRGFRIDPTNGIEIDAVGGDPVTLPTDAGAAAAATNNYNAWLAAYDAALYYHVNAYGNPGTDRTKISAMGVPPIKWGRGGYWLAGNTIRISEGQHHVIGQGAGSTNARGPTTQLLWDGTCNGIIAHEWKEPSIPGRISDYYPTPANTTIEGICFDGGGGDLSNDYTGVWCVGNGIQVRYCNFVNWSLSGCTVGAKPGNPSYATGANLCWVMFCNFLYCGFAGVTFEGGDSNAGGTMGCSFIYCGRYGVFDSSFLANTHIGNHARGVGHGASAGTTTQKIGAVSPPIVSYNGFYWQVAAGQAAAASTTAPGSDIAIWRPIRSYGTADTAYAPGWVSGGTYVEGAAWCNDNANAPSIFLGCYQEQDCPVPYHSARGLTMQGLNFADQGSGGASMTVINNSLLNVSGGLGVRWKKYDPVVSSGGIAADTITVQLGGNAINGDILSVLGTLYWPLTMRLAFTSDRKDAGLNYANSFANAAWTYTGPQTAQQFGSAATRPYHLLIPNLVLGPIGRKVSMVAAAPTSGEIARGDLFINSAPSPSGNMAWTCTTSGTAGSTGVTKACGAIDA